MKKDDKKKEIRRILPLVWNSYQHMYDLRENSISNKINYLLIVISILFATYFGFFSYFKENLFLIPFAFQIAGFLILLKVFYVKGKMLHWFEFDETLKNIEEEVFNEKLFADLKALENDTMTNLDEMRKIITYSLIPVSFSVYLFVLLGLYKVRWINFTTFSLISLIFLLINIYFYNKRQPEFKANQSSDNYFKKLLNWENSKQFPTQLL